MNVESNDPHRLARGLLTASLAVLGGLGTADASAQTVPYVLRQYAQPFLPLVGGTAVPYFFFDDETETIPIGFAFRFYGVDYTQVNVGTNGAMSFTDSFVSTGAFGTPAMPSQLDNNGMVAPFWDDLYSHAGAVTYAVQGAAPNRELVVQWENVGHYTAGTASQSNLTMQVRLSEASGAVQMHYGPFNRVASEDSLWAGTIGIENESGTDAVLGLPCAASSACGVTELMALQDQVIEISTPAGVELVGRGIAPTGGNPGDAISIPLTVENIGTLSSTAAFDVEVYFSADATIDGSDILLGTATFPAPLAANAAVTATVASVVPNQPPGFYYVGALVDANDTVQESVEANNTVLLTSRFLVGSDLSVAVQTPPDSGPGESIAVTVSVLNLGAAQPAVPVRVYYSTDQALDPGDTLVATATVSVPAAPSTDFDFPVVIPNLVPGTYYVIAEVDPDNVIAEADETNNLGVSAGLTELQGPDLTGDAIDATGDFAFRGGQLEVFGTIGNEGLATGANFYYGIYLSDNQLCSAVSDPLLGDFGPVTLSPGETLDFTQLVAVPPALPAVPHYVCLIVNNRSSVLEGNQSNNIARTQRTLDVRDPQADFSISEVRLPPRAAAGESVTLQRTLYNGGNALGTVDYEVFLSTDAAIDETQDILLGSASAALAAGAEDIGVDVLRIPSSVAGGAYYVIYRVDPANAVEELYEDNNVRASGGTLVVLPSELVILTASLPLGTVDVPYDVYLAASGGAGGLVWSIEQGTLPAGISLEPATGRLFGTPTQTASVDLLVSVTDGALTATAEFTLLVASRSTELEIATRALPVGFVGRDYQYPLTPFGGVPPYRWEITSPDPLPTGIVFTEDGTFGGVARTTGLVQLNLRVTDAVGAFAERPLVLRVVEAGDAVRMSNDVLPDARLGEAYDETFRVASGTGSSPFSFSVASGELPPGLSFEGDRVFGTPTEVGLFVFSVRVEDSRRDFDVNTYVIEVEEGREGVSFVTRGLPRATVGEAYLDGGAAVVIRAITGVESASVSMSLVSGALPAGLSMAEDGEISGTPTESGTSSFLVLARDTVGQMDVRAYGIVVDEAPEDPTTTLPIDNGCRCVEGGAGSSWAWALAPFFALLLRRRRRGLLASLLVGAALLPGAAWAQTQVPYFVDIRSEPYVEMSGGTQVNFPFSNDDDEAQVTLPFAFRYYGVDYTTVNVGTNGLLVFGSGAFSLSNTTFPSSSTPNNVIAPWWADLITSSVTTYEMGIAPARIFVVQYANVVAYSGAVGSPRFQVWFYEGVGGKFEVHYGDPGATGSGWFASAGWENALGTEGGNLLSCTSPNCDGADLAAAADTVVRVQQDAGPDISAVDVHVPAVIYAGVPFDAPVQIGSLHQSPLGPFVYTVHLMAPGDTVPNQPIYTSGPVTVAPYQTLTVTATPTVPLDTPNGRYRLALVVDAADALDEPDEGNNTFISTDTLRLAPVQPDFVVQAVEGSAAELSPGESFSASLYLRNRGNQAGAAGWRLVLSRNQVVSAEDIELSTGMVDLPLLTTATVTVSAQVPSDTPAGRYYLGVAIDPTNAVAEIDEVNNTGVNAAPISISADVVSVQTSALPGGYVGIDYTHFLQASGGDGAYAWSVASGALPAGLTLIPNRGEIRGRPTAEASSTFTVQVESAGEVATKELTLTVIEPDGGLTIVTQNLLPGVVGAAYPPAEDAPISVQQHIEALGNQGEVRFSVEGNLPAGLELDEDGYLHGTPVQAGVFDVTVVAADDLVEARRTFPLTIANPGRLTVVASRLPDGRLGDNYDFALRVIGNSRTATVTFTEQGPTPPGIVVSDSGRVVGIPQQVGTWVFIVEASEGAGPNAATDTATFRLTVVEDGGFEIVERSVPVATVGEAYEATLSTRGGEAPLVWRIMGQQLPRGITTEVVMDTSDEAKFRLRGTPEEEDLVTVLVSVTDDAGRLAERAFTIEVRAPVEEVPTPVDNGCICARPKPGVTGLWLLAGLVALVVTRRRR